MVRLLRHTTREVAHVVGKTAGAAGRGRSRVLDSLRGVRTSDLIPLELLGVADPNRVGHYPSPWNVLKRVLDSSRVSPADVFFDIGSGLGRVVYLAARYPFARVEGVEISHELAAISRANIERARSRLRCPEVTIVNCDALDYRLPDDATYVYLFNPFKRGIFQAVLDELVASIERCPRPLRLIYLHPVEHDRVMQTGRAELIRIDTGPRFLPGPRAPQTAHVYRLT
jgi:SAM-dependent methyltransferase